MREKILTFGFIVMLLVSAVGITVGGLFEEEVGANELMGDFIELYTWEDLHNMRDDLTGIYRLMNDLGPEDVGYDDYASENANDSAGWLPVGEKPGWPVDGEAFTGNFDGQNYTIAGLYINRPSTNYIGLFGFVDGGEVRNVGLVDANVSGDRRVGGLVGVNVDGTVDNLYATGTVSGGWGVGGLVGVNHIESTVKNSYATGTVIGDSTYVGGLVGINRGSVSNSYATGNVSGDKFAVGGLVGLNEGGTVSNSYATGTLNGDRRIGGLVGWNSGTVSNSYATGDVSGGGWYVGGLVGVNVYGTVSNSYATGNVSGDWSVGGLVGRNSGTVSNSYATGTVSGGGWYVGGFVGENSGTVENSFWDTETSGTTSSDGGTGKTTVEMMSISTFTGAEWDIIVIAYLDDKNTDYTWNIVDGETYPFLSGREPVDDNVLPMWLLPLIGPIVVVLLVLLFMKKKKGSSEIIPEAEAKHDKDNDDFRDEENILDEEKQEKISRLDSAYAEGKITKDLYKKNKKKILDDMDS